MEQFNVVALVQGMPKKIGSFMRGLKRPRAEIMTAYQPATPHSDLIKRPACPKCGTAMRLFGIEMKSRADELHSFECPACQHIGTDVAKIP